MAKTGVSLSPSTVSHKQHKPQTWLSSLALLAFLVLPGKIKTQAADRIWVVPSTKMTGAKDQELDTRKPGNH